MAVLGMIFALIVGAALGFGLFAVLCGTPIMAVFLMMAGGAMIGFVSGMLFMRGGYLALLTEERWDKRYIMEQSDRRADEQSRCLHC